MVQKATLYIINSKCVYLNMYISRRKVVNLYWWSPHLLANSIRMLIIKVMLSGWSRSSLGGGRDLWCHLLQQGSICHPYATRLHRRRGTSYTINIVCTYIESSYYVSNAFFKNESKYLYQSVFYFSYVFNVLQPFIENLCCKMYLPPTLKRNFFATSTKR